MRRAAAIGSFALIAAVLAGVLAGPAMALPGENGRIAFVSNDGSGNAIYTVDPDGTDQQLVAYGNHPSMSPDGSKVAFTEVDPAAGGGFDLDVVVVNADGSGGETNLTQESPLFAPMDEQPAWSPDGTQIAWVRRAALGLDEIWVMDADGSNRAQLTSISAPLGSNKGNIEPTWSPDGSKIYFTSTRDDDAEIYVMDADGSNETRLTDTDGVDFGPNVSPDGSTVAFTSERDVGFQIYTMNADGSNETRLSDGTFLELDASYSPDGSQIAVTSYRAGGTQTEIWTMDADGTNPERVTDMDALNSVPDWGPAGDACTVRGTTGNDDLVGTGGDDVICGLRGNDRISGGGGDDILRGHAGDDNLFGGPGDDVVDGGAGRDAASYRNNAGAGVNADLDAGAATDPFGDTDVFFRAGGQATVEDLNGTPFADVLTGNGQANLLIGYGGNDTVNGRSGQDVVEAGDGDDALTGGGLDDVLRPGPGSDSLVGGPGSDTANYGGIHTAGVTASLSGGVATGLPGSDKGSDTLDSMEHLVGTEFDDVLSAQSTFHHTSIRARGGNDTLDVLDSDARDSINGGSGTNACTYDVVFGLAERHINCST